MVKIRTVDSMGGIMTPEEVEATRERYYQVLKPIFFPELPAKHDIINFFASLLRVVGMEDRGWDPLLESRATLEDFNTIMQMELPADGFPSAEMTKWRLGLVMYSHMVEMDAPYEIIANLLRFQLGYGYNPNPYYQFLSKDEKKQFSKRGIYPIGKIKIIKKLSKELGVQVGDIFDEFYNQKLRNAISHSDYIFTDMDFRVRNGTGSLGAYAIPLEKLNETITRCKAFYSRFFGIEHAARHIFGEWAKKALPYDPYYKGLLEVLADKDGTMCGFRIHWPNGTDSTYRRTEDGIEMVNCMLAMQKNTIDLMVGLYARKPGSFSPLVEDGAQPIYSKREGDDRPLDWPGDGSL
ncbi:hypothetical protein ABLE93_09750 [Xanthobacter sp. KR7-65]|uniref:hypothetical protein n=1 Tax=Xanthobacter sp. KR7-65 TaxID=3156612 RepID=UPI0032B5B85C